jgi:CheY-like chemotaxis protein
MTQESVRTPRRKVLIVEDETLTAMMLEDFFLEKGFASAGIWSTGEEAVRVAASEAPDLILMDIGLPGPMDGIEAARRISAVRRVPIVLISGYSKTVLRERTPDFAPAAFLSKPIELDEVEELLPSILGAGIS